jgi:hypothetical protein
MKREDKLGEVDGGIILKWMFQEYDVKVCTGFIWPTMPTRSGL